MIPFVFSPIELLHGTGKGKQVCIVKYVCTINEPHLPKCFAKSPTAQDMFQAIPGLNDDVFVDVCMTAYCHLQVRNIKPLSHAGLKLCWGDH